MCCDRSSSVLKVSRPKVLDPTPSIACRRSNEPASNLIDGNLSNVGNVDNLSNTPFYVLTLVRAISNLKAVWIYARNDTAWNELSRVNVSLSTSATPSAGTFSRCASNVTATGQAAVMRVACEGAAAGRSWQYVHIQRDNSGGANVNFGLAEVRVMSGGG